MHPKPTEIIDKKQLSKRLTISKSTIDRLIRSGELPVIRVRTRVLFDWEECVQAMKNQSQKEAA